MWIHNTINRVSSTRIILSGLFYRVRPSSSFHIIIEHKRSTLDINLPEKYIKIYPYDHSKWDYQRNAISYNHNKSGRNLITFVCIDLISSWTLEMFWTPPTSTLRAFRSASSPSSRLFTSFRHRSRDLFAALRLDMLSLLFTLVTILGNGHGQ